MLLLKREVAPVLLSQLGDLNEEEKSYAREIAHIPSSIPLLKSSEYNERRMGCLTLNFDLIKDHTGFMRSIIDSFMKTYEETYASNNVTNLRYWQASSIESFVRG